MVWVPDERRIMRRISLESDYPALGAWTCSCWRWFDHQGDYIKLDEGNARVAIRKNTLKHARQGNREEPGDPPLTVDGFPAHIRKRR